VLLRLINPYIYFNYFNKIMHFLTCSLKKFPIFFWKFGKLVVVRCQVRRLGGGVYVIQASWSMEDHGSVRRVSLGGR
jgi:hypothetical protein